MWFYIGCCTAFWLFLFNNNLRFNKTNKENLIAGYIVKTQDGHALASNKSWAGSGPVIAKTWACAGPVFAKIISWDANLLHAKDSVCYHTFI